MNRLLSLIVIGGATALATYGVRRWVARSGARDGRAPRPAALDTWEYEGGTVTPHETRPLQQQLG
jgi:hypothetical protein